MLHLEHPLDPCCDNCLWKTNHTHHFESIYDLISFLDTSFGREPIAHPPDDGNSNLGSTTSAKAWGNLHAGNHLTMCCWVLEDWWYGYWKKNYQLCSWGAVGVMPNPVLSTLASSIKVKTFEDLLEIASNWGYAWKYGHDVLLLLKEANHEYQLESQVQRMKMRQANKKCKLEVLQMDEESKVSQGPTHSGSSIIPLALVHIQMISPIVIKHIEQPTQPQPTWLWPTWPWSPPLQPQPVLISHPYVCTDVFDVLMDNLRHM